MTRKDFKLIASTVKTIPDEFVRAYIARLFSANLKLANPAFKPDVFLKACGNIPK